MMATLTLDADLPLRVIPDVHGEARRLERLADEAAAAGRFVLQLGDVVDRGPDSAGALSYMLDLMDAGAGAMLLANHEWKLLRVLEGRDVRLGEEPKRSLAQIKAIPGLADRFLASKARLALWARAGRRLFAHAAWHPAMTDPDLDAQTAPEAVLARAIYGQTTGSVDARGRPERVYHWIDDLPNGLDVVIGHDWRGPGVVLRRKGRLGGAAHLLDLGCGKGGPLAYLDLDPDGAARWSHPLVDWSGAVLIDAT